MPRGRVPGPGRLIKRGAVWCLDMRDETGKRRFISLSTNRATAMQLWPTIVHRRDMARHGLGSIAGQEKPLADLVGEYVADLRPRVCPRHAEMVEARLAKVLARLGPLRVADLKPLAVTRLRNEILAGGVAARTANLTVDSLNACLRWAEQNELVVKNPIARVARLPDGPAHARRRRRALTDEEIEALLAAVDAEDRELARIAELDGATRVPQRPLFLTLLTLGTRYGETIAVRWADVDLDQRVLVLRAESTKSRRQRALPLNAELISTLRMLQTLHARALGRVPTSIDRVFLTAHARPLCKPTNNLMRVLNRALARARIKRTDAEGRTVDLHALRHSAASRWARRGVALHLAQRLLGHADVRTTASIYVHTGVEDLRPALDGAPGQGRRAESA